MLLRSREAFKDYYLGKTEVNPKCRDKEKIKEEVIKMNNLLERVKITGCTHCRGSFKKYFC